MVQHTKGSGTHVPGLSESVGTGPPLLFRQPLNHHLKWGRLPVRDPSRPFLSDGLPPRWQTEDVKEKSFSTFSILFKYYQRHRGKLFRVISQVDQNSASEARPNISFKSWAKHGQNIAHMPWAKLRFRFLTQIQHEISSIFSLDLSSELQLQTFKETSALITIGALPTLPYKDHCLALSNHLHQPESHQSNPFNRS